MGRRGQTFKLFDMEGVNKIKKSDVGNVMRGMKLRPDEGQLADLMAEFTSGNEVTLDEMRQIVDKYPSIATHELDPEAIKQALYIFDKKGTREIPRAEFLSVMSSTAFGHPFSNAEIQNLLNLLGIDDDADVPIDAMVDKFAEDL